jgi:DGQHR domain-containing protein
MPPVPLPALRVRQWLEEWDGVDYAADQRRARPQPHFYLLPMSATLLRRLSGISRRTEQAGLRTDDLGIQRRHDRERSEEIARYVHNGYPWSDLSAARRAEGGYSDLRKPGWLATAVLVNVLSPGEERNGKFLMVDDAVSVRDDDERRASLLIPEPAMHPGWSPSAPPLEVIDGQHRLWAFQEDESIPDFEVPVVAFYNLDRSWQAYLFWMINVKPKRINPSLAFDLYPLLRHEEWLERLSGHSIYRETRAQELVEALWANPRSPWYRRINMLGDPGRGPMVSQAAWVRSLMATFVKSSQRSATPGLYGGGTSLTGEALEWTRAQQAAYLIYLWQAMRTAIQDSADEWARRLRSDPDAIAADDLDPAFYGPHSLITTDQGIRGALYVFNDVSVAGPVSASLAAWSFDSRDSEVMDQEVVSRALDDLTGREAVREFANVLTAELAAYDWRTSAATSLGPSDKMKKQALRGGGGYRVLRVDLLEHLAASQAAPIREAATSILAALGESIE